MVTQAGRTCVSLSFVASRVIYLRLFLAVSIRREIKEAAPRVCSAFMPHHIHMEKKSSKSFLADSGSMTHAICDDSIVLENEESRF